MTSTGQVMTCIWPGWPIFKTVHRNSTVFIWDSRPCAHFSLSSNCLRYSRLCLLSPTFLDDMEANSSPFKVINDKDFFYFCFRYSIVRVLIMCLHTDNIGIVFNASTENINWNGIRIHRHGTVFSIFEFLMICYLFLSVLIGCQS